jgi:hypothetical protein
MMGLSHRDVVNADFAGAKYLPLRSTHPTPAVFHHSLSSFGLFDLFWLFLFFFENDRSISRAMDSELPDC